jgi:hypothetical protein
MIDEIFIFYDEKEGYDQYINLAHTAWKLIYPNTKITIFYIGNKPNVSNLVYTQELPAIDGVPDSYAINVYKFLYPITLHNDYTLLVSTHRTLPLNHKYFQEKLKIISDDKITHLLTNLDENTKQFSYMIGKPSVWRKLFNISNIIAYTQDLFRKDLSHNHLYKEMNNDYSICIDDLKMNNVPQMMRLTNREFMTFNEMYSSLPVAKRDELFKKAMKTSLQENHYIDFIVSSKYDKYKDYISYIFEILYVPSTSGLKIINDNSPLMRI